MVCHMCESDEPVETARTKRTRNSMTTMPNGRLLKCDHRSKHVRPISGHRIGAPHRAR